MEYSTTARNAIRFNYSLVGLRHSQNQITITTTIAGKTKDNKWRSDNVKVA